MPIYRSIYVVSNVCSFSHVKAPALVHPLDSRPAFESECCVATCRDGSCLTVNLRLENTQKPNCLCSHLFTVDSAQSLSPTKNQQICKTNPKNFVVLNRQIVTSRILHSTHPRRGLTQRETRYCVKCACVRKWLRNVTGKRNGLDIAWLIYNLLYNMVE